jgi:hypothetical protein
MDTPNPTNPTPPAETPPVSPNPPVGTEPIPPKVESFLNQQPQAQQPMKPHHTKKFFTMLLILV